MSRTGKIAKLPEILQEELNGQLERGVPGRILVEWLNAHPGVQAVLREFFGGAPVNEQNLSAWRRGGFADWQMRRQFFDQVREVAADTGDFENVASKMAGHAARLLSAHYALALSKLPAPRAVRCGDPASDPDPYASLSRLKPLAAVTRCVVALRSSEHRAARLKMEAQALASAPAPSVPLVPSVPSAEREDQPESSQIKVVRIHPNPAIATRQELPAPSSPHSSQKPPASPFPPRLVLNFPPAPHFVATPPLPSQAA